jgi:hypothetical protein
MTPEEAREWRKRSVARYQVARQKPPSRSTKPLTAQQARKRAEDAEYRANSQKRDEYARGRCEFTWDGIRCIRVATQTHHRVRRSQRVDHSLENLMRACLWCHQRAHLNVALAKEWGWIKSAHPKIGESPMES